MFGLFSITMQTLAWSLCMKSVILDGDLLIVRGIFRADVVPLSNVRNVFQNFWFPLKKVHPIVIQFGSPCRFGTHILFIPKGDGVRLRKQWRDQGWIEHPVVQEIRDEVARVNGTIPKGTDFVAS